MKQITIATLMLALIPFFSFTVLKAPVTTKVSWAKESYDFGEIPKGKPVSIEFFFTNTGDEPLLIADVKTSCQCTASDYTKEPIAPGKSSKIKVSYSAATTGAFTKAITVDFQDPALQKVLTIKGTVK